MTEMLTENWSPLNVGPETVMKRSRFRRNAGPVFDQSPEWWINRLYTALVKRSEPVLKFEDYYCGDHPLPWLAEQARDEFRRVLRMTRSNYMGLVVDSMVERMCVEGFRVEDQVDDELWRIWQANDMDGESDQAWLEAAKSGSAYALVGPNKADSKTPLMSIEHPLQAIVEHVPGSRRRRAAGLKTWRDDWTNTISAELHLPGWVFPFSSKAADGATPTWSMGEPYKSGIDVVPLVELPNNPRLLLGGVSELADLTDIQDRINKTLADRLITQDYGAFPQKWATGYPEEDASGQPADPVDIGRNRMVTTDVKETVFGQFAAAPMDPYSTAKREDVKDIASRSRTPAQYLLGEMSNVNGETLKASESGLVSKVRQRQRGHETGLEELMRLAARYAGLEDRALVRMETIWRDPQYRTEGEATDAAVKRFQGGIVPLRQTREDLRYTAEQIRRMEEADAAAAGDALLAGLLRPTAGTLEATGAAVGA